MNSTFKVILAAAAVVAVVVAGISLPASRSTPPWRTESRQSPSVPIAPAESQLRRLSPIPGRSDDWLSALPLGSWRSDARRSSPVDCSPRGWTKPRVRDRRNKPTAELLARSTAVQLGLSRHTPSKIRANGRSSSIPPASARRVEDLGNALGGSPTDDRDATPSQTDVTLADPRERVELSLSATRRRLRRRGPVRTWIAPGGDPRMRRGYSKTSDARRSAEPWSTSSTSDGDSASSSTRRLVSRVPPRQRTDALAGGPRRDRLTSIAASSP